MAGSGETVVRLKGGDPFVFARGGEEAAALAAAGVTYEVVPGITSALAVPAYAGIPVTLRYSSTSFTVVTGHEDPERDEGSVDWEAVARVGGTIIVLMGVGPLAGRSPLGCRRADFRPTHRWPRCIGVHAPSSGRCGPRSPRWTRHELEAPSVIVIGDVAAGPRLVRAQALVREADRGHSCASAGVGAGAPPGGPRR